MDADGWAIESMFGKHWLLNGERRPALPVERQLDRETNSLQAIRSWRQDSNSSDITVFNHDCNILELEYDVFLICEKIVGL